jgi:hypothetical protein
MREKGRMGERKDDNKQQAASNKQASYEGKRANGRKERW